MESHWLRLESIELPKASIQGPNTPVPKLPTPPEETAHVERPIPPHESPMLPVPPYNVILYGGPRDAEWLLEWDDATLIVQAPDGETVLETVPTAVYQQIDLYEMYAQGKISIGSPKGAVCTFRKEYRALPAVRELVEAGIARDTKFCAELQRQAMRVIVGGLLMFAVGGTLFGLYCWYAIKVGDPPRGHWIWWFAWLIATVVMILSMCMALAGPLRCHYGLRLWIRMRHIARSAKTA